MLLLWKESKKILNWKKQSKQKIKKLFIIILSKYYSYSFKLTNECLNSIIAYHTQRK